MDPGAEGEVRIGAALEHDLIGAIERTGVAVGGRELKGQLLAARDGLAAIKLKITVALPWERA